MAKIPISIILLFQLLSIMAKVSGQSACSQYFALARDSTTNEVVGQIQIPSPPKNVNLELKIELSIAVELPSKYVGRLELAQSKEASVTLVQQGFPLSYIVYFPLQQPIPTLTGIWFNKQRYCSASPAVGSIVTTIGLEHTLFPNSPILPNSLPEENKPYFSIPQFSSNKPSNVPSNIPFNIPSNLPSNPFTIPSNRPSNLPSNPFTIPSNLPSNPFTIPSNRPSNLPSNLFTIPSNRPSNLPSNVPFNIPSNRPLNIPSNIPSNRSPSIRPTIRPTIRPFNRPPIRPSYSLPTTRKPTTQRPIQMTTFTTPFSFTEGTDFLNPNQYQNSINDCGRTSFMDTINPLIARGEEISPGQWPWLVAILRARIKLELQCAGSLITNKHVITAAHCFKKNSDENEDLPASVLLVSLGQYRRNDYREEGYVDREIQSYAIHPSYNHKSLSADSDIAILILRIPVEFTFTVKPICLWHGSSILQNVINQSGYIVGWGKDENGNYLEEPRMVRAPITSQEDCLWSDDRFVRATSNRTFCAGTRDGSGPCNGDSGSGLMLYDSSSRSYQLRGIVSRSLYDEGQTKCDLTKYVIFVDVAKYMDWITQQIST